MWEGATNGVLSSESTLARLAWARVFARSLRSLILLQIQAYTSGRLQKDGMNHEDQRNDYDR